MMSVVRRIVVSTALGGGLIYAGVTGLSPASAQTNTPTPKATATTKAPSSQKHNCPNDKAGSSSSGSNTSTTSFSSL